MAVLGKACPFCGEWTEIHLTEEQLDRYYDEYADRQKPVQVVFPELSAEKREFLITGMCKECQHEVFG